jgi:TM2 domain-containing membrane protein YozV
MKKNVFYLTGLVFLALLSSCGTSNVARVGNPEMEVMASVPRNHYQQNKIAELKENEIIEEVVIHNVLAETKTKESISVNNLKEKNNNILTELVNSKNEEVSFKETPVLVANASNNTFTKSQLKNNIIGKKITIVERVKIRFVEKMKRMLPNGGKSQLVAFLLAFFLGYLGIHRFYLGYIGIGIIQLLTGGLCIWAFIDWIRIITGGLQPKNGQYGTTMGNK